MARFFGAEYLVGTSDSDSLDDEMLRSSLPAIVHGDLGNDTISGFPGDTLIGGSGNDVLSTGTLSGNDVLYGGGGNDRFEYDASFFSNNFGEQRIFGDAGFDTLAVSVSNGYFSDALETELRDYAAMLDAGEDPGRGGEYAFENLPLRASGIERIVVFDGESVTIDGGSVPLPSDGQSVASSPAPRRAVEEAPAPVGKAGAARTPVSTPDLTGDDGSNSIEGDETDDLIRGFGDDDLLVGREGFDLLIGGSGDDTLIGNEGRDTLRGGSGDDLLEGRKGRDLLRGGAGEDTLNGGAKADKLVGGGNADILIGGYGKDSLYGGQGFDRLVGGDGDDLLKGAGGNDILIGGRGSDVFVFGAVFNKDRIADFDVENDRMDFSSHAGVSGLADLTLRQVGADLFITDGAGGQIKLNNVDLADIDASDFIF